MVGDGNVGGRSPWGKILGFGAVGCLLVGGILAFVIFRLVGGLASAIGEVMNEETFEVSSPGSFDPFAGLGEVKSHVGSGAILVSIEASGVRSDGTMNLNAEYSPAPRAAYKFVEPTKDGADKMPPIGAGRGPDDIWARDVTAEAYKPGQRSHISKRGGSINAEYWHVNQGVTLKFGDPSAHRPAEPLPVPSLTTKQMWEKALELGAPKDAVARIEYDESGYEFAITGSRINLYWNQNGEFDEERSR